MSVAELKEKHSAAMKTVNNIRERLKQRRQQLLALMLPGMQDRKGRIQSLLVQRIWFVAEPCKVGHTGKVYDWTPEWNRIVGASQDGRLIVWNALTSQKTHAIKLPCAWVMTCAFSPTGQSVACGGLDGMCSSFNLNSPTDRDGKLPVSKTLSGHKGYVSCCQYVPDEDMHLITSSGDQTYSMGYYDWPQNFRFQGRISIRTYCRCA